jgi:GTP-binding protein
MRNVPILFTSVLEKKRLHKALEEAMEVHHERHKRVPTSELNEKLLPLIENEPPPMDGKHRVRIKYVHQAPGPTPAFVFHCNRPKAIKGPYKRFLEKQLRRLYGFKGVPVRTFFRKK